MPKKMVMLRMPPHMLDEIDTLAKYKGVTRTAMIILLITAPLTKAGNEKRVDDKRRDERNGRNIEAS